MFHPQFGLTGRRFGLARQAGQIGQFIAVPRIGRARRSRCPKQAPGVDVLPDQPVDCLQIIESRFLAVGGKTTVVRKAGEAGEIAGQETGGKVPQLEVHGHELRVDRLIAVRREQPVLLPQHRADLVESGRPKLVNPLANDRRRQPAASRSLLQREMDSRVEQQTPTANQDVVGRGFGQLLRIRPGQQHDLLRQHGVSGQAEFRLIDGLQERFAADDVTRTMRNPQAEAAQPPILLDDPTENPRQNKKRRRIGRSYRAL